MAHSGIFFTYWVFPVGELNDRYDSYEQLFEKKQKNIKAASNIFFLLLINLLIHFLM